MSVLSQIKLVIVNVYCCFSSDEFRAPSANFELNTCMALLWSSQFDIVISFILYVVKGRLRF